MKELISYLNDLKEESGSDYASAKLLKISKVSVSLIRKRGQMGDKTAVKLAKLLKLKPEEILIAANIARSKDEIKKHYKNISKELEKTNFLLN